MGEVKREELVNVLSNTLPALSQYINRIVTLLPKDVNDIDTESINTIQPIVKEMLTYTRNTLQKVKPPGNLSNDDEIEKIYSMYFKAISDILGGVESLYSYLQNKKDASEEDLAIFIRKLYEGSIEIVSLVERITE